MEEKMLELLEILKKQQLQIEKLQFLAAKHEERFRITQDLILKLNDRLPKIENA